MACATLSSHLANAASLITTTSHHHEQLRTLSAALRALSASKGMQSALTAARRRLGWREGVSASHLLPTTTTTAAGASFTVAICLPTHTPHAFASPLLAAAADDHDWRRRDQHRRHFRRCSGGGGLVCVTLVAKG